MAQSQSIKDECLGGLKYAGTAGSRHTPKANSISGAPQPRWPIPAQPKGTHSGLSHAHPKGISMFRDCPATMASPSATTRHIMASFKMASPTHIQEAHPPSGTPRPRWPLPAQLKGTSWPPLRWPLPRTSERHTHLQGLPGHNGLPKRPLILLRLLHAGHGICTDLKAWRGGGNGGQLLNLSR
eukprot:1161454-Pelagomonas_calceolata.AAC.3